MYGAEIQSSFMYLVWNDQYDITILEKATEQAWW